MPRVLLHYTLPQRGFFQVTIDGSPDLGDLDDVEKLCSLSIAALRRQYGVVEKRDPCDPTVYYDKEAEVYVGSISALGIISQGTTELEARLAVLDAAVMHLSAKSLLMSGPAPKGDTRP